MHFGREDVLSFLLYMYACIKIGGPFLTTGTQFAQTWILHDPWMSHVNLKYTPVTGSWEEDFLIL